MGRKVYRTRVEARAGVFDYIDPSYNPTCRHLALGYRRPVQVEQARKA